MPETLFRFKEFEVAQEACAMKINTDGVLLGAWTDVDGKNRILDIGTGSGVIALMLAQRSQASRIIGIDIDPDAVEEARSNMESSPWSDRLEVLSASIQDFSYSSNESFDLIVCNPPFFSGGTLSATQEKSVVRHTIKMPHNDLLRSAYTLLSPSGIFSVVLPHIEGLRFVEMAEQYRFSCCKMTEVTSFPDSKVERLLISLTKQKEVELTKDQLSIRNEDSEFSKAYKSLTKDFYLKF